MNQVIENVVASASEELNVNSQDYAAWFMVLIEQCMATFKYAKIIDPNKRTALEVYDSKTSLPTELMELKKVFPFPEDSESVPYAEGIDYVHQGDILIFDPEVGIDDGEKVSILYKGLKVDADGSICVPANFERMLVSYIGWKFCRRYMGTDVDQRRVMHIKMQDYKREYTNLKPSMA